MHVLLCLPTKSTVSNANMFFLTLPQVKPVITKSLMNTGITVLTLQTDSLCSTPDYKDSMRSGIISYFMTHYDIRLSMAENMLYVMLLYNQRQKID